MPMAVKYYQAEGKKGVTNCLFLTSTVQKNNPPSLATCNRRKTYISPAIGGTFLMKTAQRYFFKKKDRLKSSKAIDNLFSKGNSFSTFPFKVLWMQGESILQAGIGVSSKNFKKAVDRNRIKRLMREAYRLQKHELQKTLEQKNTSLSLFILYYGNEVPKYEIVFDRIGSIIKRLIKIVNENDQADT